MIDLYYGNLSIEDICKEITEILKTENHYKKDEYISFLNSIGKKYRKIKLSDGSGWTMLIGREAERYIHIHPSRASKRTIRVRAIALKTALMLLIYRELSDLENELVPAVNDIRLNYLGESPIKNESYTKGLRRVLKVFASASGEHKLLQSNPSLRR